MTEKSQTFLLTVAILEGRHYAWLNMDSAVIVKIDNKFKCTSVKRKTDCPFYNEYFVFEFYTTFHDMIEKQMSVTVIEPRNIWRKRKILGYITLDIATVWQQKNHQFYHKWAILTAPKMETFTGPQGYIKMDISILSKSEVPKVPLHIINDEIEGNLLLPEGTFTERQKAKYIFNIYRAQYVVDKLSNTVEDYNLEFKENSKSSGPTTFVEIMFAGMAIRTSMKKQTSFPVFNEKLTIIDLFPPLCQIVRIQLCYGDTIKKKVHSSKSINMQLISNNKNEGFLPTFGPNLVHLYRHNELEGYAGSIIMSMDTEIEEGVMSDSKKSTLVESIPPLIEDKYFVYEGVTLFSIIYGVTAIHKKYSKDPICIKVTFGRMNVQQKSSASGEQLIINSTIPQKARKMGKKYFYLEINENKPCLWITEKVQFFKKRIYNSNFISSIARELKSKLEYIETLFLRPDMKLFSEEIDAKLLDAVDFISVAAKKYIDIATSYSDDYQTKLDKERRKMCLQVMQDISENIESIYQKQFKKRTFRKLEKKYRCIEALLEDVQDCWPDILIWIVHGKKKVAYRRIAARDIIYSPITEERGQFCGVKRTLCFYANDKDHKSLSLTLDVSLFLCLDRHQDDFTSGIPSGFEFDEEITKLPNKMSAKEKYVFQLRAHIFQGKISYGYDKTGLADPFVRIIFNNEVKETQVIYACLNPVWDETLIFDNVTLYGSKSHLTTNVPTILIEGFDRDEFYKNELLGRTVVQPNIVINGNTYLPPKLKWTKLYLNEEVAAEILAAFELIELTAKDYLQPLDIPHKYKLEIPIGIKPDLTPHKMEILFWGVRELRKVNLFHINRPRISVFCGDVSLNSDTIENAMKDPNFKTQVKKLDLILPTQLDYAPPIRFRIFDSRRFGVYSFGGIHISHISSFIEYPMKREERKKQLSGIQYKSFDSLDSESASSLNIQLKSRKGEETDSDTENNDKLKEDRSCFLIEYMKRILKLRNEKLNYKTSGTSLRTYETLPQQDNLNYEDYDWWTKFYASLKPLDADDDNIPENQIQKLQIYGNELENQPEFGGFTDMLMSFELYRGKRMGDEAIDENKITSVFKGSVKIYQWPIDNENYVTARGWPLEEGFFKNFPQNTPLRYLLRVYCIRALNLRPKDVNGKSDPYLFLTVNDKFINDKENFITRQLNPIFGRCFEFDAIFPQDHSLKIAVWDRDISSLDDLIGETRIDLESRYYTKHRAHCGIAEKYEGSGYCTWREYNKPTTILSDLCRKWNTDPPKYSSTGVRIGFKEFTSENFSLSNDPEYDKEVLALIALRRWREMPIVGFTLVPEHVETRSLYKSSKPGIEQGKIQLWIDIFPVIDLPPPKKVNITPRKPNKYELRVIVWNTADVTLDEDDFFTGEKKSDIYVKCWLNDMMEAQYTDVHYRSLTGEGNFNWRFVFPFQYLPAENKLVVYKKESIFESDETEFKMPCVLTMQVWDNDTFSKDDFLGTKRVIYNQIIMEI
ncbi:ferlin family C2 domain-containing myoferlin misfire isoform X2 [Leptinotarsa decemlineata]|uniref:ferlin family C2 domain-containing myoferlin misfire isoform X2 n=1 Tax=Leptinotarsa decemlineata TaxID=7539 RepID=UPI003D30B8F5